MCIQQEERSRFRVHLSLFVSFFCIFKVANESVTIDLSVKEFSVSRNGSLGGGGREKLHGCPLEVGTWERPVQDMGY